MGSGKFINLYIYCDSLAFRRTGQPQDISFTYPFILKELIEIRLGIRANLLIRGWGGANISNIKETIALDSQYFGSDGLVLNLAILQFGIVDCAPKPFTHKLIPMLRKIPIAGSTILAKFAKHRRRLQTLCSYTITATHKFKEEYTSIVKICHGSKILPIALGMPLPPYSIEQRSPRFRHNVSVYNQLIRDAIPESFCDIEQQMTEPLRDSLLLPDGHHLTESGHRFYAEQVFDKIKELL